MNKIKALILEVSGGVYEGNEWQAIVARVQGRLMRFKVDVKRVHFTTSDVDKDVELEYELSGSASSPALVRIVGFE